MRTLFLAALCIFPLVSCASSGSSRAKKFAPDTYNGLEKRKIFGYGGSVSPKAKCAPGWKRDPDLDSFLTGNETE
ncbi:MAG: hypothetical protein KDB61_16540, partial [Planctomycetes bacterium]|nr:hypothetical protein [Planctomycetota bacterium]